MICVFSSMIEIEYVRWLGLSFPEFKYYYMTYYIPNCPKMNYKSSKCTYLVNLTPCQLLCPVTYKFVQFTEEIKAKTVRIANGE